LSCKKYKGKRERMEEQTFNLTMKEIEKIIDTAVERAVLKTKEEGNNEENVQRKRKYLKIKEFAEIFNVTRVAVHDWIITKKIYAERLYGTKIWRIPIEEVEKYKDRSRKETNNDIFKRKF
jgi:excisionase family DNA binding protein